MYRCVSEFRRKATGLVSRVCSTEVRGRRWREASGSMSTQVVIFSVMLFGASGVVLDFGRVYSEHSQMQSYTDQAALAAAAELDFESDAIDRAVAAVFGANDLAPLSKDATWSSGEGNTFNIEYLIFLNELSTDTGRQTSMGDMSQASSIYVAFANGADSGDKALAASEAKFVVAVAEERSVRNSLVQLVNTVEDNSIPDANVVKAIAAAKRKAVNCGNRTNLVMCNPFEASNTSLRSFIDDGAGNQGVQFHMIADGTLSDSQRLGMLSVPQSSDEITSLCNDVTTLPGYFPGMSDEESRRAMLICHLAAAQPTEYCVEENVEIIPADAGVIQTALGSAFDMWDAPLASVLAPGVADSTKALFQPDIDIAKGRVRQPDATITANEALGIPASSRLNYTETHSDFNLSLSACFRQNNAAFCQPGRSHVSVPYSYVEMLDYYINYWQHHFFFVAGGAIPGFEVSTMYRAYAFERTEWPYSPIKDFEAPFGEAESLARTITDSDGVVKREDGNLNSDTGPDFFVPHQDNFSNYSNATIPLDDQERRRFGVTFVNCGVAETEFNTDLGIDVSSAPVVAFADMYLVHPPKPQCADGTENCLNEDLSLSRVFMEFVEQSDTRENVYSVLVR